MRKAKIEDLRFHDLRRTFASRLVQAGVDLYMIQKLLGHEDPRRYSNRSVESLRAGIEVLEILKKRAKGRRFFTILSQPELAGRREIFRLDQKLNKSYI